MKCDSCSYADELYVRNICEDDYHKCNKLKKAYLCCYNGRVVNEDDVEDCEFYKSNIAYSPRVGYVGD